MKEDIKTIEKNENRKIVVQRTKWRPIYEVIDEDYIKNSHICQWFQYLRSFSLCVLLLFFIF